MRGFENQDHARSCWEALKLSNLPLKFAYSGSAAHTHNTLALQESYQEIVLAIDAEIDALTKLTDKTIAPIQVCEIGPGNGIHSIAFLSHLLHTGVSINSYLALDFSANLLGILRDKIADSFPQIKAVYNTWDFESGPTGSIDLWRNTSPVTILLLGHTLGNPYNPLECLENIFASSKTGDTLLVSVATKHTSNGEIYTKSYLNDIFIAAATEPLAMCGIDVSAGRFILRWDHDISAVVGDFVFNRICSIRSVYGELKYTPGSSIRCFHSKRYAPEDVLSLLSLAGWSPVRTSFTKDSAHMAVSSLHK